MACERLLEYLDENSVPYELTRHPAAYTAQEIADRAGVSGKRFAKTVMVKLDGRLAMAVVPGSDKVNFALLRQASGAGIVVLATEEDFREKFPDCDMGAMPPFGNLYGLEVYVADELATEGAIAFNAGTHSELITMPWSDFVRLVRPVSGRFSFRRLRALRAGA